MNINKDYLFNLYGYTSQQKQSTICFAFSNYPSPCFFKEEVDVILTAIK